MSITVALTVVGLVLLSSIIQRIAGMGFGMILAPFIVVMLGAHEGIMLVNFLSIVAPVLVVPRVWPDIEWRRVMWIGVPAMAIMPAAAWLSVNSPAGPLYMLVAALVLFGLSSSLILRRINRRIDGKAAQVITGIGSGAGTVLGGVGGPAVTIYAVLSRWPLISMIATLQPMWIMMSAVSFGSKLAFDDGQLPGLPWWAWVGSAAAIVLGIFVGEWVQRRVDEKLVRRLVVVLAFLGALLALATGLREMLG